MSDAINPDHYKRLPAEAIEIIEAAIDNAPSVQAAYLHGQALKYLLRCWAKNGIEDLRKAKWYLDRLIDSFDESEQKQSAWTPRVGDWVKVTKPEFGECVWLSPEMDKFDGATVRVGSLADLSDYVFADGVDGYAFHFDWLEPADQPVIKQSSTTEPPDGWRWLEVGEVIRKGDRYWYENEWNDRKGEIGVKFNEDHLGTIRRNKFEVGEKVVGVLNGVVYKVIRILSMGYQLESEFCAEVIFYGKDLAPYIEEQS